MATVDAWLAQQKYKQDMAETSKVGKGGEEVVVVEIRQQAR